MAKKAIKKTVKQASPTASKTAKKTTVSTTTKKVARKTTSSKPGKSSSDKKKATPKPGKGKVKIESSSKSLSEASDLDKLDTIIYSKSRKESKEAGSYESGSGNIKSKRGRAVKKDAKVEADPTNSGDSRSKSPKNQSQETYLKKSAKQQVSGKVDTQSISDELSKIIKRLEVKKVQQTSKSPTDKKGSSKHKQKITAKLVNYTLQKNPKNKSNVVIDLFELAKKQEFNNSDVLLAIIEIAYHRTCYIFPDSPKSNSFWEEIVQFNEFKRLFQFYRPETLKKYWRYLSYKQCFVHGISILQKKKKFLDDKKPKLLTIISGIQNVCTKSITDFEDFINHPHKYLNFGMPSDRDPTFSGRKRGKALEKVFKGNNYTTEIKNFLGKDGAQPIILLEEKDEVKSKLYIS